MTARGSGLMLHAIFVTSYCHKIVTMGFVPQYLLSHIHGTFVNWDYWAWELPCCGDTTITHILRGIHKRHNFWGATHIKYSGASYLQRISAGISTVTCCNSQGLGALLLAIFL